MRRGCCEVVLLLGTRAQKGRGDSRCQRTKEPSSLAAASENKPRQKLRSLPCGQKERGRTVRYLSKAVARMCVECTQTKERKCC